MAIPAQIEHEEYGAIHASSANRTSSRAVRLMQITAAIAMCMAATVLLGNSPTSPFEDEVELEIMSPQEKLDRLVNDFANNGAKMSVAEMETKLDQWRHNPETLLDLPQSARTQVSHICCSTWQYSIENLRPYLIATIYLPIKTQQLAD